MSEIISVAGCHGKLLRGGRAGDPYGGITKPALCDNERPGDGLGSAKNPSANTYDLGGSSNALLGPGSE